MKALVPTPARSKIRTHVVREQRVMLDEHLTTLFGVETRRLNEQVRRNEVRFEGYAFRLTQAEFRALTSQDAISNPGRGGRRHPPWVFTEHGVVMAATVLNSDAAIAAMRLVVDVFVRERRGLAGATHPVASTAAVGLLPRLQGALEALLDTVVDHRAQRTVRQEAQELLAHSIQHLKDQLNRPSLENEEIGARVAKTQAEVSEIELRTLARRVRLAIEAERAIAVGELDSFLAVLENLGRA